MMNNFIGLDTRNRRSLNKNSFLPIHVPVSNYSIDAQTKERMKDTYNALFLNNLHLIPDPLKKNLADSVITEKDMNLMKTKEYLAKEVEKPPSSQSSDFYPKLRNIISGVIGVMGAMFQWRDSSPSSQYYDCFESEYIENSDEQKSGSVPWQSANRDVQNKNGWAQSTFDSNNENNWKSEMITDALTDDQISLLLNSDSNLIHITCSSNNKKPFEPGSADEFEDAFCPDECPSLPNNSYLEYYSPFCYQDEEKCNAYGSNTKAEQVKESSQKSENSKNILNTEESVVSSCEDKLYKLKALLKSKCTKLKESSEYDENSTDSDNGKITDTKTVFGDEINIPKTSSLDCILKTRMCDLVDHFNEVTGKFNSSSVDSDDSFQIVFTDDAREARRRIPSECESEDSFIVFEESPDSCYISDDVFGEAAINNCSDSDTSDSEDDSGCESTKLFPNLSRTVEDLTDDRLYGEDAVDGSMRIGEHYNIRDSPSDPLLKEDANTEKKKKPLKKVRFSSEPPKVHQMRVWAFAARQARIGEWEQHARDRERFKSRINDVEMAISWVLKPKHRKLVMFQRFMPWWNAQKRKELEEQKQLKEKEIGKEKEQQEEKQQLEEKKQLRENTQVEEKTQIEDKKQLGDNKQPKENTQLEEKNKLEENVQLEEKKEPDKTELEDDKDIQFGLMSQIRQNTWDKKDETTTQQSSTNDR